MGHPPPPAQPPKPQTPKEIRDGALAAHMLEARARLASAPAALELRGEPVAPPPEKVASAASRMLRRQWARVANPKLHARDVRRVPPPPFPDWMASARKAALAREPGDPLFPTLMQCASLLATFCRQAAQGACRATFEQIATGAGCCVETARRCIRFLERAELIDTANVLERRPIAGVTRLILGANLYLLRGAAEPDEGAPPAADALPMVPGDRAAATIRRWAASFGLAMRPQGWNRTPSVAPSG